MIWWFFGQCSLRRSHSPKKKWLGRSWKPEGYSPFKPRQSAASTHPQAPWPSWKRERWSTTSCKANRLNIGWMKKLFQLNFPKSREENHGKSLFWGCWTKLWWLKKLFQPKLSVGVSCLEPPDSVEWLEWGALRSYNQTFPTWMKSSKQP